MEQDPIINAISRRPPRGSPRILNLDPCRAFR
jgi:hypothetical protein